MLEASKFYPKKEYLKYSFFYALYSKEYQSFMEQQINGLR